MSNACGSLGPTSTCLEGTENSRLDSEPILLRLQLPWARPQWEDTRPRPLRGCVSLALREMTILAFLPAHEFVFSRRDTVSARG